MQGAADDNAATAAMCEPEEPEEPEERLFVVLASLCAGHALTLRDAGRITRSMAANSVLPLMQYEVRAVHLQGRPLRALPCLVGRRTSGTRSSM